MKASFFIGADLLHYSRYRNLFKSTGTMPLTFRPTAPLAFLLGGGSKIRCCRLGGRVEYSGIHFISPAQGNCFSFIIINYSKISMLSYRQGVLVFIKWR